MQDSKEISWATDFESDQDSHADDSGLPRTSDNAAGQNDDSAKADGWQQYRKWISKAPAPRSRRSGLDPSLYTWKGYRNWTEQVKRNWSDS